MPIYFGNNKVAPSGVVKVYYGNNLVYQKTTPVVFTGLCFTANTAGSTVTMSANGSAPSMSLKYSRDGSSWSTFTIGSTVVALTNVGDKVYFKGNNSCTATSESKYNGFVLTGSIAASGDITSLLSETGNVLDLSDYSSYLFDSLFMDCTSLTAPPLLPSTTLCSYCYHRMFSGCSNMTIAPALPATNLAANCYRSMLKETGIIVPPVFPALTMQNSSYYAIFENCTSLTTVARVPATTLASNCYVNMYKGCTGIKMSSSSSSTYTNEYVFGATPSSTYANYMFTGTGGSFTGTPTKKTYYTSNPVIG